MQLNTLKIDEKLGFTIADSITKDIIFEWKSYKVPDIKWKNSKDFCRIDLLKCEKLKHNSSIVKFATSEILLNTITKYLNCLPKLYYALIYYVRPTPISQKPYSIQIPHLDSGSEKQIKVFVNLSNITKQSGPMQFIDASETEKLINLHSITRSKRSYLCQIDNSKVKNIPSISCIGSVGTCYLIDTARCFHWTSDEAIEPKLVLQLLYTLPVTRGLKGRSSLSHLIMPNMSADIKYLLS